MSAPKNPSALDAMMSNYASAVRGGKRPPVPASVFTPVNTPGPDHDPDGNPWDAQPAPPAAPDPKAAANYWPDTHTNAVLRAATTFGATITPFSTLFPTEWARIKADPSTSHLPDFDMPDYRLCDYKDAAPVTLFIGQPLAVYTFAEALSMGESLHIDGPPGTGKTEGLPPYVGHAIGLPVYQIAFNDPELSMDALAGYIGILPGGTTGYIPGLLPEWITRPCIVMGDEFFRANTGIQNAMMRLLENPGKLIIQQSNLPPVLRSPCCYLAMANNTKGLGDNADTMVGVSGLVDAAVRNRFTCWLTLDYMSAEDAANLVKLWFPGFPAAEARQLADFCALLQDGYTRRQMTTPTTPRTLRGMADRAARRRNIPDAVRASVINALADEAEIEFVGQCYRTVFGTDL